MAAGAARLSPAQVGRLLRLISLDPRRGFGVVVQRREDRADMGAGSQGPVGAVGAALGGGGLLLLWLKLSALFGLRDVARSEFRWEFLAAGFALGAVVSLAARALWSRSATRVAVAQRPSPAELRFLWGAALFPQVLPLLVLLPLDLLLVGRGAFTSERLPDAAATGWAAVSMALWVSALAWSGWIFVRGLQVVAGARGARLAAAAGLALVSVALVGAALALPALAVAESSR